MNVRRAVDATVALAAMFVLTPVFAVVALLVRTFLGRPVIFRQQRPGLHGRPFTIYKFRTLTDDHDESGMLRPDADRITRFGRILRASSLDELPELVNVLRGDMSLVGPRPLMMDYLERYTPEQARRHDVRPGLTGLAQVSGRNTLDWEDRFRLDTYYVDRQSFALDLKIIARTVLQVCRVRQTSADGHVGAPEFLGTTRAGTIR